MAGIPQLRMSIVYTGEAFQALSHTMEWTYSQYTKITSQATDKIVLPFLNWTWSKLRQASSEPDPSTPEAVKPPKRPKRCGRAADCLVQPVILITRKVKKFLTPEFLYHASQSVKQFARPYAHAKPVKIPDLEKYNGLGRAAGYTCEIMDKAGIQAATYLYFIANAGEKTWAVRLCLGEIGPELRPSFNKHFVDPILEDVEKMITGSQPDISDATLREALITTVVSRVRSEVGRGIAERVKPAIIKAIDDYLKDKESDITRAVAKIEDEVQSKAVSCVSGYLLRESLNTLVTPVLMSGALSFSAYLIALPLPEDSSGILATVRTTAYLLSYLKYIHHLLWIGTIGKSAYDLHRTYSDTVGDRITNILKGSPAALREWLDQMKKAKTYPVIVTEQYNLPAIIQTMNDQMPAETGIKFLDRAGSASPAFKYFKTHFDRFIDDVKAKSIVTLRKYDLIDFNDDLDDFQDCPPYQEGPDLAKAPSVPAPSPAAQLVNVAGPIIGLSPQTTSTLVSLVNAATKPGPTKESEEHPPTTPSLLPDAVELGTRVLSVLSSPSPNSSSEASPSPTETTSTPQSSQKSNSAPTIPDWIKKVAVVGTVASVALLGLICFRNFSAFRAFLNDLSNGKFGEGHTMIRAIFSSAIALLRQSTDNPQT